MSVPVSLGRRIKELRIKKKLTQLDLSRDLCTPSMISQIESDRARPSYKILASVADRLEVTLDRLLDDVNFNLEYVSRYKMVRAMVSAGQYLSAIPLLQELLDTPRSQITTIELQYELAECYLHSGEWTDAERMLGIVHDQALVRLDQHMLVNVFKSSGLLQFRRKHYQLATYYWQKALKEAERLPEEDQLLTASILYHLGLGFRKLGQVFEALDAHTRAFALCQNADNLQEIGHVYMHLGHSYKRLQHLDKAAEYSTQALSIFDTLNTLRMNADLQLTRAVLYGQAGQINDALILIQRAIKHYQKYNMHEQLSIAWIEFAQLCLNQGDIEGAAAACERGQKTLPTSHLYQGRLYRINGRIALEQGQHKEAIHLLQRAADHFKQLEEIGEWDDTMAELAGLYVKENDLLRAYHLLAETVEQRKTHLRKRGIVL